MIYGTRIKCDILKLNGPIDHPPKAIGFAYDNLSSKTFLLMNNRISLDDGVV